MSTEDLLPPDLRDLFTGDVDGRRLTVPLPPGRVVAGREDKRPALWLSDAPAPEGLWARLHAEHARSGLWPLLLDALDDHQEEYSPWGNGDLCPSVMSSPDDHSAADVLAGWWHGNAEEDEDISEFTAPYDQRWPGLAPAPKRGLEPDRVADGLAERVLAAHSTLRLGLVATDRGADAVTVAGWQGPLNHTDDTAELSAVLRDWEERFGARVVSVGFATLLLSVAAPPTTLEAALPVAAEHFAFCPDNIWQGDAPQTLAGYASRIVNDHSWTFWWD